MPIILTGVVGLKQNPVKPRHYEPTPGSDQATEFCTPPSSILLWVCVMGLRFLCVFPLSVPPPLQALNPDRDSKHWAALTEEPDDESVWNGASGNGDEVVIHSAWIFTSSQENPADGARAVAVRVPCVHSSGCVWVFYCSLRSFMASSAHFHTY